MPNEIQEKTAPIHKRMENPPTICLRNLTISGVALGGVSELGPSRARISAALALERPCKSKWGHRKQLFSSAEKKEVYAVCFLNVIGVMDW